jgi:predicted N-acyltransferase
MHTGQNAWAFSTKLEVKILQNEVLNAMEALKEQFKASGKKVHISSIKDFETEEIETFHPAIKKDYFQFSTQPNMVFTILENWKTEQDYIDALSKKYRDQYKRARKKAEGIEKRKLGLHEIIAFEEEIYNLYYHVAKNAPFNTFFLAKNHFRVFKEILKDKFLFYGYFIDNKLIGFNTLIKNGTAMDTYFLGYDDSIQKEKMLYLNMLYDMIAYSINKGFKEIVFARTALEIKSSVGAKPIEVYGFIKHESKLIDKCTQTIFNYLEPKTEWQERNPFK